MLACEWYPQHYQPILVSGMSAINSAKKLSACSILDSSIGLIIRIICCVCRDFINVYFTVGIDSACGSMLTFLISGAFVCYCIVGLDECVCSCLRVSTCTGFYDLQVMPWFWVVVSSYTQEELARLIQFTTGSSQLPPDGFAELRPKLQFSPAPVRGFLPTAHTWYVCVLGI